MSHPSSRPSTFGPTSSSSTSVAHNHNRHRQYSHLNSQLAQLNAHLADMENLLRMTAVQAEYVRGLGGFCGGLFMASSKILGEETAAGAGVGPKSGADADTRTGPRVQAGTAGEGAGDEEEV